MAYKITNYGDLVGSQVYQWNKDIKVLFEIEEGDEVCDAVYVSKGTGIEIASKVEPIIVGEGYEIIIPQEMLETAGDVVCFFSRNGNAFSKLTIPIIERCRPFDYK